MNEKKIDLAHNPVVLFDGVCNLCSGAVWFIAERDRAARFRFAPLQSQEGQALRANSCPGVHGRETICVVTDRDCLTQSDALLHIVRGLDGLWPVLAVFRIVPRPLRDWLYRLVARHRYRLFGRQDTCMVPSADLAGRFLSE